MSKQFLLHLNYGNASSALSRFIDSLEGREPRIAWYPSAGWDFRDLLYLSPQYAKYNPASQAEPAPPDLFLHTDYFPWGGPDFLDTRTLYEGYNTVVIAESIEMLQYLSLPLHCGIVNFPRGSIATNKVVFMNVKVGSNKLGEISYPILYAFCENESFCAEVMLPNETHISHVIHNRYGGGLGGGGKSRGGWILNVLKKLYCELFISDGRHNEIEGGDISAMKRYPILASKDAPTLTSIRSISSKLWSDYSKTIDWNLVS
ncbi:MAG: hypothetical protein LBO69_05260 [Ignavibacteria bacterium]|jgi:hypothetical protein|nr:hypothetical protein [Ignavibacteria bacterium]